MEIQETILEGCFIITPKIFEDERGYFFESYNYNHLKKATGIDLIFYQDNEAKSKYGVVRGLHLQRSNKSQTKLVRVIKGLILDVALDVRKDSPTYGKHIAVELSAENRKQLYIPHGFAHGYSVLSSEAIVAYKCDNFYHKSAEDGIYLYDNKLNIDWRIPKNNAIISDKDLNQKPFEEFDPVVL